MAKRMKLREFRLLVRKLVNEQLDDELNTVEVGDVVDVHVDELGIMPVRVLELVDDVNSVAGAPDPRNPNDFTGPGFVAEIDPDSGESGQMVFSLNQVLPGSKMKGYFPKLGALDDVGKATDWDEWGRDANNPYRKAAKRFAQQAIEPAGPMSAMSDKDEFGLDEADLDEYVANDDSNPHKAAHADPTGKAWDSGLDESDELS